MKSSTYLTRFRRLLLLGAVVAGIAVPAAGAYNGSPPDVRDVAAGLQSTLISAPPDVRDAAAAANAQVDDVFERYAKAHPFGAGLSTSSTPASRPPDVTDVALAARSGVLLGQSSGFHWSDWAIGIGSGIGLMLLVAGALAGELQRRHRMQTA